MFHIRNIEDFYKYKELLSKVCNQDCDLPYQVFRKEFGYYLFNQFDDAMSDWGTLQQLASVSKDEYIVTAVLDPKPMEYYFKEFGYFNWIKFPKNIESNEYWNALELGPENWPADSISNNSFTVVWFSPSMKWAIWGDRNYEVSILAFNNEEIFRSALPFLKSWRKFDETVISWLELAFRELPVEIVKILKANYY